MDITWSKGSTGYPNAFLKLQVPSVSRVLSEMIPDPELEEWIKSVGEEKAKEIMDYSAKRGTALHKYMELFTKKYTLTKNLQSALDYSKIMAEEELRDEHIPISFIRTGENLFNIFLYSDYKSQFENVISTEYKLYSPNYFYRGALDVFYKYQGFRVTDYKTASKKIKEYSIKEYKYKCQLGAYANAMDELLINQNIKIDYASLLIFLTNDFNIQEIALEKEELEFYKEEFRQLTINWHINNKQEFLIKNLI